MNEISADSKYRWFLFSQTLPAVLLLVLLWPYPYLSCYAGSVVLLQLFLSCVTIFNIKNLTDISFKVWLSGAVLIPLPLLIFLMRLKNDSFLFLGYYLFLMAFFFLNYALRRNAFFIPIVLFSLCGNLILWGVMELFNNMHTSFFWYSCLIITFFEDSKREIALPLLWLVGLSVVGYIVYGIEKINTKKEYHEV